MTIPNLCITGIPEAAFLLGTQYASGEGLADGKPDTKGAFEQYLKAANKGEQQQFPLSFPSPLNHRSHSHHLAHYFRLGCRPA
jgi:TPR repeat protein